MSHKEIKEKCGCRTTIKGSSKIKPFTSFDREVITKSCEPHLRLQEWNAWVEYCLCAKNSWIHAIEHLGLTLPRLLEWILECNDSNFWLHNVIEETFNPGHIFHPDELKKASNVVMELDKRLSAHFKTKKSIVPHLSLFQTFWAPMLQYRQSYFSTHFKMVDPQCRRYFESVCTDECTGTTIPANPTNLTKGTLFLWLKFANVCI